MTGVCVWLMATGGFTPPQTSGFLNQWRNHWPTPVGYLSDIERHMAKGGRF
jgi:hypothetical protein